MQTTFHDLKVSRTESQTSDAKVIYFEIPDAYQKAFEFTAGQYLTLKVDINGEEERRAYSMCTSPDEPEIGVCVKRLKGGKVSNFLIDRIQAGSTISVLPPEGRFVAATNPDQRKTYYLIGAGSGITPLMSIAKKVVESEPGSAVHLLYGNRNEESVIFKDELHAMTEKYAGQFTLDEILSQPNKKKAGGLGGFFGKKVTSWGGRVGRIDAQELKRFRTNHESRTNESEYYICGPGAMIDTVEKELLRVGVAASNIHTERFTVAKVDSADRIQGSSDAEVNVILDGKTHTISVPSDKTILEVLVAEGKNPPYSCTSGACSTCIAKVTGGEVKMDVNHALDPDEVEEGYCLTCQAHPVTASVSLSYDD